MDTLVAGTLASSGAAHDLISFWREGVFELVVSEKLMEEFSEVLARSRISDRYGITPRDIEELAAEITGDGELFEDPPDPPRLVPGDPDDDYVVALAVAGKVDALVTRDHHIHSAGLAEPTILYPGQFRTLLENVQ